MSVPDTWHTQDVDPASIRTDVQNLQNAVEDNRLQRGQSKSALDHVTPAIGLSGVNATSLNPRAPKGRHLKGGHPKMGFGIEFSLDMSMCTVLFVRQFHRESAV